MHRHPPLLVLFLCAFSQGVLLDVLSAAFLCHARDLDQGGGGGAGRRAGGGAPPAAATPSAAAGLADDSLKQIEMVVCGGGDGGADDDDEEGGGYAGAHWWCDGCSDPKWHARDVEGDNYGGSSSAGGSG